MCPEDEFKNLEWGSGSYLTLVGSKQCMPDEHFNDVGTDFKPTRVEIWKQWMLLSMMSTSLSTSYYLSSYSPRIRLLFSCS